MPRPPKLPAPVTERILQLKREHPSFGVTRIAQWLRRFFLLQASPETVRQKLHAAGFLEEAPPRRPRNLTRPRFFERATPNQMWQSDIERLLTMSEALRENLGRSARALCQGLALPYRTFLRWRARRRQGAPVVQTPGPKKIHPLPLAELESRVAELTHRPHRTFGAPALARELTQRVSTRQVRACVQTHRRNLRRAQRHSCQRVEWTAPNLAWSLDGSETRADRQEVKLRFVAFQDLAWRYFPVD